MAEQNPVDRRFHVKLAGKEKDPSGFLSGHDEVTQAEKRKDQANASAEEQGLKARYVVVDTQA